MCGLFGCYGESINMDLVRQGFLKAGTRGPHGCGLVAWKNGSGPRAYKALGPAERHLQRLSEFADGAEMILFHARLCTSGAYDRIENLQPFQCGRFWAAHNGNAHNYEYLKRIYGFEPETAVDSEIIPYLFSIMASNDFGDDAVEEIGHIVSDGHDAFIVTDGRRMFSFSDGQPLHIFRESGAVYLCSRRLESGKFEPRTKAVSFSEGGF